MPSPAIPVRCTADGATCTSLDGAVTFTRQSGTLYRATNGKSYRGNGGTGITVMLEVIDARFPVPSTPAPSLPGAGALNSKPAAGSDLYGSGSGAHDWYLILLALVTLYVVMRVWPKWGMTVGWVVLVGAILSTETAVSGFQGLVRTIQTGTIQ